MAPPALVVDTGGMQQPRSRSARTALVGTGSIVALLVSTLDVAASAPARRAEQPTINYTVSATVPKRVCVGADTTISVTVNRRVSAPDAALTLLNGGLMSVERDVVIEARIVDPTILSTDEPTQITGLDGSRPPAAVFTLHAKKQGVTTVEFTARISAMGETDGWQGDIADRTVPVQVTVTNCRFEVSVASIWRVEGEAQIDVGARFLRVELAPAADGEYRTIGHTTWYFAVSDVLDCSGTLTATGTTDAPIFASLDDSGRLFVEVRYDPVIVTNVIDCKGVRGTMTMDFQAGPLKFDVPSRGGSNSLAHDLSGTPGRSIYVVEPLDEQVLE